MTNAVYITKPDFALSDFIGSFWSFYLTFKLVIKYNYGNHLESYSRQNSLLNVICHDGIPLDYLSSLWLQSELVISLLILENSNLKPCTIAYIWLYLATVISGELTKTWTHFLAE